MTDAEGDNISSNMPHQVDRLFDDSIPAILCGLVSLTLDLLKCQLHMSLAVVLLVSMMSWASNRTVTSKTVASKRACVST
jgi:hypothetical protein